VRSILAALLAFVATTSSCTSRSHFLERSVTVGEHTYRYRVWLPPHYTKLHHWPVILYLHGSAERGDDNIRQIATGLGPAVERFGQRYKAIVVFPQCRDGEEWYGDEEAQALAALNAALIEFHGDPRRVYLTGNSMGGTGAWFLARHRKKWAAVVPVCGEVVRSGSDPYPSDPPPDIARIVGAADPYATLAEAIGKTPVWAFHGAADETVSVEQSRNMVAALQKAGGIVRYTEFAGVGHDAWDLTYANPSMVSWLLAQRTK